MALQYRTKEGDMLDWIAWRQYGQGFNIVEAALAMDPRLAEATQDVQNTNQDPFNNLALLIQQGKDNLEGVVESILEANPGLVDYGLRLPANVIINLPDLSPTITEFQTVRLWD